MVKRIILFLMVTLYSYSAYSVEILAKVNKEIISDVDVRQYASMLRYINPATQGKSDAEVRKMALYELMIMSMKDQMASKNGVAVSQADLKETKNRIFQGKKVDLPFNEKVYDRNLKTQIMWARFVNGRFGPKANITDSEVNDFLEQLKKSGAHPGSSINLSQIVTDTEEHALQIYDTIKDTKSCAEFNKAAEEMGHPGSGNIGKVNLNQMDKDVATMLKNTPTGKVLPPHKTEVGQAIFFICSRTYPSKSEDEKLKEQLETNLIQQKAEALGDKYLKDSINEFYIEILNPRYQDIMDELI